MSPEKINKKTLENILPKLEPIGKSRKFYVLEESLCKKIPEEYTEFPQFTRGKYHTYSKITYFANSNDSIFKKYNKIRRKRKKQGWNDYPLYREMCKDGYSILYDISQKEIFT